MYDENLALNNPQGLRCHKTKPNLIKQTISDDILIMLKKTNPKSKKENQVDKFLFIISTLLHHVYLIHL